MRKRGSCSDIMCKVFLFSCLFLFIFTVKMSRAGELVKARYQNASGEKIVLNLSIGSPPPASIIIMQYLPQGISLRNSQPQAAKVIAGKGEVKWLLKGISPGNMAVRMDLSRPVSPNEIKAEVRYRHPKTGKFSQVNLTNN